MSILIAFWIGLDSEEFSVELGVQSSELWFVKRLLLSFDLVGTVGLPSLLLAAAEARVEELNLHKYLNQECLLSCWSPFFILLGVFWTGFLSPPCWRSIKLRFLECSS